MNGVNHMSIRLCTCLTLTLLVAARPRPGPAAPRTVSIELTDARILGTLGAGDVDQIEAAKLAMTKGSSSGVRDYAKMLVHDHQESFKENTEIAKRFKISRMLPDDSAMARAHKQEMAQLNLLTGSAFDLAFLQAMVADHVALIKEINTTLLPGAQRNGVKAFIRKLIPVLTGHQLLGQTLLDKPK
jgi:putative membrane protein